tara:strand:- start:3358 stop:4863 length:1506 start_codon:yes stop_codon:yes gene_type:complete
MQNSFFHIPYSETSIALRLRELDKAKVGFYSVGLYPISLAYNCVMQSKVDSLMLAPREGRDLYGAFSKSELSKMENKYLEQIESMSLNNIDGKKVYNTLSDLILKCDLIVLSSNSNHIEDDLNQAINLRQTLNRNQVLISCLVGSFCRDKSSNKSYLLCEKESNLAFFSGFHRHGALLNPLDSFTANFCHPDALTAMLGAKILDKLSPNIQVSSGVHNLEGQYIKAAKNISSIFAGFAHTYHRDNPGLLPTILTLLLDQCLDQAATISMFRSQTTDLYEDQFFSITEMGYGVQKIEASLLKNGNTKQVRDHTFSQLTAMVADVRGSMMQPVAGKPTRNFQAGQVLASNMFNLKRCPHDIHEFIQWCETAGLKKGGLEGIKSLEYWPQIKNNFSIESHDSSMINLLYICILGPSEIKKIIYLVMTKSRELSNFCQQSVRPSHSRRFALALSSLEKDESVKLIIDSIMHRNSINYDLKLDIENNDSTKAFPHLEAIKMIDDLL